MQLRLHQNACNRVTWAGKLRRHLHRRYDRIVHDHQSYIVIDTWRPAILFKIRPLRNRGRQHAGMRPNPNHQLIRLTPLDCLRHVEPCGGKTRLMLADAHAVQVGHRTELRLIYFEQCYRVLIRRLKSLPIPEVIPLLMRNSAGTAQFVIIRLAISALMNQV